MSASTRVGQIDRAVDYLRERLAAGPVASHEIRAETAGRFGRETLARARFRLGVVIDTGSEPGKPFVTHWRLPEHETETEEHTMREETDYDWATIVAYNRAWLDQQQGKQFYFTPPGGKRQPVRLGRLPVSRGNISRWRVDLVDFPGIEVFDVRKEDRP